MSACVLLLAGLVAQAPNAAAPAQQGAERGSVALVGKIRVTGPAISRRVNVLVDGKPMALSGDLTRELGRLGSAKVEVLGSQHGEKFAVKQYRILDVGGGTKPLVGELVSVGDALALRDGDGDPISLSAASRALARLKKKIGAKIWVSGERLLSGEMKVTRYGILRDPPKK